MVVSASRGAIPWRQAAPWIITVYLVGVVLMLLRLLASLVHSQRLANQAKPLTEGPLLTTIQALARRWSMRFVPVLAETERVVAPRVVGLMRPVILLPASAVSGLSFDELELILGHELAHIRRHDMWIVLVQRVAEAALFYNPALWYLSRRISALREYCCDDAACEAHEPLRYAATLMKLIELAAPELAAGAPLALAAQGRSPSELRRRVARLLGEPLREPLRLTRGAALTSAVSLLLLAFLPAMTRSEPQPRANSEASNQKVASDAGAKNRFSFGGKIEVLALGTHDQNNDRWWDAQGNPLKPLPEPLVGCMVPQIDEQGKPVASLPISWKKDGEVSAGNVVWRRIIMRVRGLPDDADVTWRIAEAHASGGSEVNVNGERNPRGYFSRYFGVPAEQKTTAVKVGVATGKWKSAAEVQPPGMAAIGRQDLSLVFSETFDTPQGAAIVVSHDCFNRDFRVVAIDKQDTLHDTAGRGGASAGKIYQTRATFPNLKRNDIDHFEFQTRDYEYVELSALPLDPPAKP